MAESIPHLQVTHGFDARPVTRFLARAHKPSKNPGLCGVFLPPNQPTHFINRFCSALGTYLIHLSSSAASAAGASAASTLLPTPPAFSQPAGHGRRLTIHS